MSFLRRPHPHSASSAKRQRVPHDQVRVSELAPLPLQVEAVRDDYLATSHAATFARSGVVTAPDGTSFSWMVFASHVHVWRVTESSHQDDQYVRLSTFCQSGFDNQRCWLWIGEPPASLPSRGNANGFRYTVVLCTSAGQVLCWPVGTGSPSSISLGLHQEDSLVCFAPLGVGQQGFVLCSKTGTLYLCWLSQRDVSVHFRRVEQHQSNPEESKESAVFGGVLGLFGLRGSTTEKKRPIRTPPTVAMVVEAEESSSSKLTLFTVGADWTITKWSLQWESVEGVEQISSKVLWSTALLKVRSSALREGDFCIGAVLLNSNNLLLGVLNPSNTPQVHASVAVVYVSGIDGVDESGIRTGFSTGALEVLTEEMYHRSMPAQSASQWSLEQVEQRVSLSHRFIDGTEQVILYVHIRSPQLHLGTKEQYIAGTTVSTKTPDISRSEVETVWYSSVTDLEFGDPLATSGNSTWFWSGTSPGVPGLVLVSPTVGMFTVQLVGLANADNPDSRPRLTRKTEQATLPTSRSITTSTPRRSSNKVNQDEGSTILAKLLRTFMAAHAKGEPGMIAVTEDPECESLGLLQQGMICQIVEKVAMEHTQRKPGQRWAELRSGSDSFVESFSPELILRSLHAKKEELLALCTIVRELNLVAADHQTTRPTHLLLGELVEKLDGSINLCLFQQAVQDYKQDEFDKIAECLMAAMQQVVKERGGFQDMTQLSEHLQLAGLSITDMFYSKPASIAQIIPVLQDTIHDASLCGLMNQICQAICVGINTRHFDVCHWQDCNLFVKALGKQLDSTAEVLSQYGNGFSLQVSFCRSGNLPNSLVPTAAVPIKALADQMSQLSDVYLDAVSPTDATNAALESFLGEKRRCIGPLVKIAEQLAITCSYGNDDINEMAQVAEAIAINALALGEKYLHYETLESVCSLEARLHPDDSRGVERLLWYMNKSQSTIFTMEDVNDKVDDESRCIALRGPFGFYLSVSPDGNLAGSETVADDRSTFRVHSIGGKVQFESMSNGKYLSFHSTPLTNQLTEKSESKARPFSLSSVPDDTCKFTLEQVNGNDDDQLWRLVSSTGHSLSIDQSGVVGAVESVDDWSDLPTHVFQWCLENKSTRGLMELARDGSQAFALASFLDEKEHDELDPSVRSTLYKVRWPLAIQMSKFDDAVKYAKHESAHIAAHSSVSSTGFIVNEEGARDPREMATVLDSIAKLSALAV